VVVAAVAVVAVDGISDSSSIDSQMDVSVATTAA
jgi:hypothetical protein